MRDSIRLFIILVLLFFAADRLVYTLIRQIDENVFTGQSGGKVNQFLSLKDSVTTLVFGSSRALHHVDTKQIDSNSYNIGVDGTRIGYSAALISSLHKKEQNILVHIDPSAIYNIDYNADDMLGLLNVAKRNKEIGDFIKEIYPKEIYLSKIFNCYVYNGKILGLVKNYFVKSNYSNDYYGYDPIVPSKEQKEIFKKLIAKTDFDTFEYQNIYEYPNPLVEKLIISIQEKCKENNSNLIFFTSPSLQKNPEYLKAKTKDFFNSKGIRYYDFSEFIDMLNLDHWKDFTHLSEEGAKLFSKELNIVLKENNKQLVE
jgi:hypothetical protein